MGSSRTRGLKVEQVRNALEVASRHTGMTTSAITRIALREWLTRNGYEFALVYDANSVITDDGTLGL